MKRGMVALLYLAGALALRADEIRLGPRVSGGWSKDVGDSAQFWQPQPVYSVGLQAEWDHDSGLYSAFELAYDQVGMSNNYRSLIFIGTSPYILEPGDYHQVEEQVAESLQGGWRGAWWGERLRPRAYLGYQFTQALDQRSWWTYNQGQHSENSTLYLDQDHRYRSFGQLGLGLGLGRTDAVVLDLRLSQQLWHQSGFFINSYYAKWQLGVTWFYSLPIH